MVAKRGVGGLDRGTLAPARDVRPAPTDSKKVKGIRTPPTAGASGLLSKAYWPKTETPKQHQITALEFVILNLEFDESAYLALDAGLGKTIVAAMLANFYSGYTVFYVCPPFLTTNTDEEFSKWCFNKKLYLIPDSTIWKKKQLKDFAEAVRKAGRKSLLIVDEAHRFKNLQAVRVFRGGKEFTVFKPARAGALFKNIFPHFGKAVFMSGTPMPNSRAKELWPILEHAAPHIFGKKYFNFALKYCGAFKTEFGWNFDGFTNRKEFKARLTKSFMLRMKKDVLNLPKKHEGLLTVGKKLTPVISGLEKKILAQYSPEDLIEGEITKIAGATALHLSTYLKLLGEYKVKFVLPYIESLLNETEEKLLVFAVHKGAIASLEKGLRKYNPIVVKGGVPKKKRHAFVKEFQTNPERRLWIGQIEASGLGLTLTKATRAILVEFSWVDGANTQATDRMHRIGQKLECFVQYVVLKDSFDRTRMESLLKKRALSI